MKKMLYLVICFYIAFMVAGMSVSVQDDATAGSWAFHDDSVKWY